MFNLALSKLHVAEDSGVDATLSKSLLKEALGLFRQASTAHHVASHFMVGKPKMFHISFLWN
jgi:hypothetical protein